MLQVVVTSQFKKDYKNLAKSGYDITKLNDVINVLSRGDKLEAKYKDHKLQGKLSKYRECHVDPDVLLVYRIENDNLILVLYRTGTHSKLF